MFRAITGELPFDACARRGILTHHLITPLPPTSWLAEELDDSIDRLVLSATRKHPDNLDTPAWPTFSRISRRPTTGIPSWGFRAGSSRMRTDQRPTAARQVFDSLSEEV